MMAMSYISGVAPQPNQFFWMTKIVILLDGDINNQFELKKFFIWMQWYEWILKTLKNSSFIRAK